MAANPEAIAWYVKRSEDLLDDLRERVQSFRTRGVQLAGFSGAVLALAGANAESILTALHGPARDCAGAALLAGSFLLIASFVTSLLPRQVSELAGAEVRYYTQDRLIEEPDLWRVHVRTIKGLLRSIEWTAHQGDKAARAIGRAELLLSAGLVAVGIAIAILVTMVTF